jgi:hypothetical protein
MAMLVCILHTVSLAESHMEDTRLALEVQVHFTYRVTPCQCLSTSAPFNEPPYRFSIERLAVSDSLCYIHWKYPCGMPVVYAALPMVLSSPSLKHILI